jgi:LPXTG-site transpeptidase (sortase) family protein
MTAALPRARRRVRPRLVGVVAALAVVAAVVLAYVGSNVSASLHQRTLERRFDASAATWDGLDPLARSSLDYAAGAPVARLTISAIGLDAIVAEGATPAIMRGAPGHLPSSAVPGESGVALVTANRFGFGSFFLRLDRLDVGDEIVTQSAWGLTTYTVVEVSVISKDELDLTADSTDRELVLFASGRLWGGGDRIVVRALADVNR